MAGNVKSILVVDTNFIVSQLLIVAELLDLSPQYGFLIVIPWCVVQELDGLKTSKLSVGTEARNANKWIYDELGSNNPCIRGQMLSEINKPYSSGDDQILDCCQYYHEKWNAFTAILTNDKNLCTKALIHKVRTISYVPGMTANIIAAKICEEVGFTDPQESHDSSMMDIDEDMVGVEDTQVAAATEETAATETTFQEFAFRVKTTLFEGIKNCIDYHLKQAYDEDELKYFQYVPSRIQDMSDIAQIIKRFQISVFSEILPQKVSKALVNAPKYLEMPKDLEQYIDIWGAVWLHMAVKTRTEKTVSQTLESLKITAKHYGH